MAVRNLDGNAVAAELAAPRIELEPAQPVDDVSVSHGWRADGTAGRAGGLHREWKTEWRVRLARRFARRTRPAAFYVRHEFITTPPPVLPPPRERSAEAADRQPAQAVAVSPRAARRPVV